jgi:capsular polysaccharide export protein
MDVAGQGGPGQATLCWIDSASTLTGLDTCTVVRGECDPWHLLGGARSVIADEGDELCLLAAASGVPVTVVSQRRLVELDSAKAIALLAERLCAFDHFDPFTGERIDAAEAIALCGSWRDLIDSNRGLTGAVGFAFWKRETVAPLLWTGSGDVRFITGARGLRPGDRLAAWKSRVPPAALGDLEAEGVQLIEVEDGFIRSSGLGADCVPPLSIIVDPVGIHFDPSRPSALELLLQSGSFPDALLERARRLRETLVRSGLSKYESGAAASAREPAWRRQILVPGQVEDDRSVIEGGCGLASNFELLRRVRAQAPEAHIIYKPHPDVEAGHRQGAIAGSTCLTIADEIARGETISSLLDGVDEVHVNTSLSGFEALLRGKTVVTHGVPFFAGWGLTTDLGPVPERRTAKRTLDELVAATLLLYPRYVDPVTLLPCPAEVVVDRLANGAASGTDGLVVRLRRMQGRLRRSLAAVYSLVAA